MADNTQVSENPIIATDKIGGIDFQRVKVTWGIDGVAVDASETNPLPVSVSDGAVRIVGSTSAYADVFASAGSYSGQVVFVAGASGYLAEVSENGIEVDVATKTIGDTLGVDRGMVIFAVRDDAVATISESENEYTGLRVDSQGKLWVRAVIPDSEGNDLSFSLPSELTATPSIFTGACAQYDSLHTSVMQFSGAANGLGGTGRILGARLVNKHDSFTGVVALHLFRDNPSGTNAGETLSVSDADKLNHFGTLTFDFSAFPPLGGGRVATADRSVLPLDYKCDAGESSIYGILQLISAHTPTFAADSLVPFLSFVAD